MALQERDFLNKKAGTTLPSCTCPKCRHGNDYQVRWITRTKKDRFPPYV